MDLPERWSPVKLDGNASKGMVLLADLHRPRLGVRWQTLKEKADVTKAIDRAMRDEVGELAAKECVDALPPGGDWIGGKLYVEPQPPGRDVWIGYSRTTRRLFQVIHHAKHRDAALRDQLLPTLSDDAAGEWSIFDLSCKLPPDAKLLKHRLNVGDLTLEFTRGRDVFAVRQIAVASVALQRQPIEKWLVSQQSARKQFYRAAAVSRPATMLEYDGITRTLVRRRRHFVLRWKPKNIIGFAVHDESRDKLLILESSNETELLKIVESVGWSQPEAVE